MNFSDDLKKVVEFHGHICPGLAYGYRVAKAALQELGPRSRDEELVAIVENDSCSVDAIQVMTGCTFGKGNLVFRDLGKSVYTFFSRSTGKGVRISVDFEYDETPQETVARKKYTSGDRSDDIMQIIAESKAKKIQSILDTSEDKLLKKTPISETSEVSEALPAKARIYPSVRCASCKEKTMEPRIRLNNGNLVCMSCAENT